MGCGRFFPASACFFRAVRAFCRPVGTFLGPVRAFSGPCGVFVIRGEVFGVRWEVFAMGGGPGCGWEGKAGCRTCGFLKVSRRRIFPFGEVLIATVANGISVRKKTVMNNEIIRNHYDVFDNIKSFAGKHGSRFAAGSRATGLFNELASVVAGMEENGVKKISGTAGFLGGTDAKQLAADQVREDMRAIRDTAEAISEAEGLPEFDDQFRMPRSGSFVVLLVRAKAFLEDAGPHAALFVEFELPATFLTDLDKHIKLLEKGGDDQNAGLSEQVAGTAELSAFTVQGTNCASSCCPS